MFLQAHDCISMVQSDAFRIKGCIHAYTLEDHHPKRTLEDLRAVHLWKWHKGKDAVAGTFNFISYEHEEAEHIGFLTAARPQGSGRAAGGARDVAGLLLQLKGLLRG